MAFSQTCKSSRTSALNAEASGRRTFFATAAAGLLAASAAPAPAEASYTGYTQREADWDSRVKNGEVQISSARALRSQLADIAPMNSEGSKLFCPNGEPSNVSPLMENRCGDRQATVSVYGRQQDTVGNSVPGFSGGYYPSIMSGSSSSSSDSNSNLANSPMVGGFPKYPNQK
eukprot:CAMPEP_0198287340 /NCGR_PEP_ID=MMETSP1449-20131203/6203_1 /TAXON_ID=420275 /ORGANISM="Attheya septentrionalis, Strain CCMP2084" /LENGTH=172 /DNA_ID=CAMNT_0043985287 /DNA_START=178 /DNA_END=696 /DNA_ORIENTATION=+